MTTITKAELIEKYKTMRTFDLAKELGICVSTLARLLKANGIELKKPGEKVYSKKKVMVI